MGTRDKDTKLVPAQMDRILRKLSKNSLMDMVMHLLAKHEHSKSMGAPKSVAAFLDLFDEEWKIVAEKRKDRFTPWRSTTLNEAKRLRNLTRGRGPGDKAMYIEAAERLERLAGKE